MSFPKPLMFDQLAPMMPVSQAVCPHCTLVGASSTPEAQLLNNSMVWCLRCKRLAVSPLPLEAHCVHNAPWLYRQTLAVLLTVPQTDEEDGGIPRLPLRFERRTANRYGCRLVNGNEILDMDVFTLGEQDDKRLSYQSCPAETVNTASKLQYLSFLGRLETGVGGKMVRTCPQEKLRMVANLSLRML